MSGSERQYLEVGPWPFLNDRSIKDEVIPDERNARLDVESAEEPIPRDGSPNAERLDHQEPAPNSGAFEFPSPLSTKVLSEMLSRCGQSAPSRLYLTLNWEIFEYVRLEMRSRQYLGDMLIATGTPKNAWITQCREYLKHSSPIAGGPMLHLMESITSPHTLTKLDARIETEIECCKKRLGFVVYERRHGMSYMTAYGSPFLLTDIMNVITWFTATFRPRPDHLDSDVLMSKASIALTSDPKGVFGTISTTPLVPAHQGLCWTRLYRGICTQGFPIRPCKDFNGAEISFEHMAALAGIIEESYRDGIFSLRGNDHALYPTAISKDGNTVLWHTSSCEEFDNLQAVVPDAGECCRNSNPHNLLKEYQRRRRHILGYTEKGRISIGTAEYPLHVPNRRSGASMQKSRLCFRRKANINFGSSGMGMVGGGITLELGFSRSQVAKMDLTPSLYRQIHSAANRPLILYDLTGHVGYLVPETSAILHIALSWFSNSARCLKENELSKLPRAGLVSDGGSAARDCIIAACEQDLVLHGVHGEKWKFRDAIQDALAAIRSCRGLSSSTPTEYTKSVWEKFHRKDVLLYGWDLADYIANEETMYRQEVRVKTSATDSWMTHIARHPKMLVIFTKDLQPPIVLDEPDRMCKMWNPLPAADLLLSSSQCITDLMQTCGGDPASARLTSHECYLHRREPVHAFADCTFDGRSRCYRIHVLRSEPPKCVEQLPPEGAVLFGSSSAPKSAICQPQMSQETLCAVTEKTLAGCDALRICDVAQES